MPDEKKVTIFHPSWVKWTEGTSSLGPVEFVEIPGDEFTDEVDIHVREEDFPKGDDD